MKKNNNRRAVVKTVKSKLGEKIRRLVFKTRPRKRK